MNWEGCVAIVVVAAVVSVIFLVIPSCRPARRGWDRLDGRHGPQVIGRDTLIQADTGFVVAARHEDVPDG